MVSTTNPTTAENDPLIDIETNIRMSVVLLQKCVEKSISKFIYPSSGGAVYGINSSDDTDENTLPMPISPYAIGKLTIEHYLDYFHVKHGLKSVVYRISNPYGDRQSLASKQGVIPIFLNQIRDREPITFLGDGTMMRDYIYVKDVANMITKSFVKTKSSIYNLGSGHGTTLNELLAVIRKITGTNPKIIRKPEPSTFVKKIVLNTEKFQKEFDIKPETGLETGIKNLWSHINQS